jgi:hypothetical protein
MSWFGGASDLRAESCSSKWAISGLLFLRDVLREYPSHADQSSFALDGGELADTTKIDWRG